MVGWTAHRYVTLMLVAVAHVALLLAAILGCRHYQPQMPITRPLELAVIPAPRRRSEALPKFDFAPKVLVSSAGAAASITLGVPAAELPREPTRTIDWYAEQPPTARALAADAARKRRAAPAAADSSWFPAAVHHKGEEIALGNGQTMIFISDHCYQLSSVMPSVATASNNGMALPTYCKGDSKEPRGDLFKELQAYERAHPVH